MYFYIYPQKWLYRTGARSHGNNSIGHYWITNALNIGKPLTSTFAWHVRYSTYVRFMQFHLAPFIFIKIIHICTMDSSATFESTFLLMSVLRCFYTERFSYLDFESILLNYDKTVHCIVEYRYINSSVGNTASELGRGPVLWWNSHLILGNVLKLENNKADFLYNIAPVITVEAIKSCECFCVFLSGSRDDGIPRIPLSVLC